jgi:hypothetical protein
MTKYQVEVNRTFVYEVEADSKEAAVNKVDEGLVWPTYDEFQYATATEVAKPVYEFSATEEELIATYPVSLPDSEEEGSVQFRLTTEGLIVDVFDHNGEEIATFARTSQESADDLCTLP